MVELLKGMLKTLLGPRCLIRFDISRILGLNNSLFCFNSNAQTIPHIILILHKFEFKNLVKGLKNSLKEKTFFKDLRKEVETGANGTQDYVVKKGVNKNTVATTRQ